MAAAGAIARPRARWQRRASFAQDAALVIVSAFFFFMHVRHLAEGSFTSLAFAAEQGILIGVFLFRRRSRATSTRPFDWLVAAGSWLPLAMQLRESPAALETAGIALQTAGLAMTCVGFMYLGRSFGVVAANRGLKVNGPYRLVRHPIYASHFVTLAGFALANGWWLNVALLAVITACQLLRIRAEERVLEETDLYAEYRQRVRWRLLPGVY